MSDLWLGPNDLGKGMVESNSSTGEVGVAVSDLRKPERMSSGKGLWRGLSKCSSSDLGKPERMLTDLTKSERMSTDLRKSKRISTDLRMSKRICLGKGLWIGVGKCNASYPLWKGKEKEKEKRKRVSKIHLRLKSYFPSGINHYFPSTFVPIIPNTRGRVLRPIVVPYSPTNKNCVKFVKGQKLEKDVVSLLSNDGKRDYLVRNNGVNESVDSIARKHLLICCFKMPLPNECEEAYICRAMIAAYSHLVKNNEKFEMVMVPEMVHPSDVDDEETAFNQFFKAFPCLAVPFCDVESRNFLCRSLNLTSPSPSYAAVVLDPDQVVLQSDGMCFYRYGASGFPYSDAQLDALRREDAKIRCRLSFLFYKGPLAAPTSLVELLGSDVVLSRFGGGDKMYASDMSKKKCVVLFLCVNGWRLKQVERIRKRCAAGNLECEVVLVHIPFMWDTDSFVNVVQLDLERLKLSSWWVAPLIDEEEGRRLWRLCHQDQNDNFIILADGGNAVELDGPEFMDNFGSVLPNKTYPFTRMTMAHDFFDPLRKVTLESLLRDNVGGSVPVSDLKDRKVLLYLDWCENVCKGEGRLYKKLLRYYDKIKKVHPDLEVVLVPLQCECPEDNVVRRRWLVLRRADAIWKQLNVDRIGPIPTCVAFGEDGFIRSRKAQRRLKGGRLKGGSLFKDTLMREIINNLQGYPWWYY